MYARATCQPREVVVPLNMELMGTVAKQLVPSCVTVQRCGGCCPDDGLECVPTGQHQVRMQVGGRGSVPGWMLAFWGVRGWRPEPWAVGKVFSPLQPSLTVSLPVLLSPDPHDPVPKQSAGGDVPGRTQPVRMQVPGRPHLGVRRDQAWGALGVAVHRSGDKVSEGGARQAWDRGRESGECWAS